MLDVVEGVQFGEDLVEVEGGRGRRGEHVELVVAAGGAPVGGQLVFLGVKILLINMK